MSRRRRRGHGISWGRAGGRRRKPGRQSGKKKIFGLALALGGGWVVIYLVPLWTWYVILALLAVGLIGLLVFT